MFPTLNMNLDIYLFWHLWIWVMWSVDWRQLHFFSVMETKSNCFITEASCLTQFLQAGNLTEDDRKFFPRDKNLLPSWWSHGIRSLSFFGGMGRDPRVDWLEHWRLNPKTHRFDTHNPQGTSCSEPSCREWVLDSVEGCGGQSSEGAEMGIDLLQTLVQRKVSL